MQVKYFERRDNLQNQLRKFLAQEEVQLNKFLQNTEEKEIDYEWLEEHQVVKM